MTCRTAPIQFESLPSIKWGTIQPLRLTTSDAQELGGWYVASKKNQPAVLLLHGNGGSRGDCLDQTEWLVDAGYPVLLITLRCHGDSTGDRNDFGYSARFDVLAAITWLEQHGHNQPIIWGRSLGSAAALFASSELGYRVRGYVLECPYRDLRTAVRNRLNTRLLPPLDWIAYAGLSLTSPLVLGDVDRLSPQDASAGFPKNVPVLLLAGGDDKRAKPEEAFSIAGQIGPRARVVVFDWAGHLELNRTDPTRYRETGLQFLASCQVAD